MKFLRQDGVVGVGGEGVTRLGIPGKDSPWGEFNPFDPPAEISESQHRKNGYPTWGQPPT